MIYKYFTNFSKVLIFQRYYCYYCHRLSLQYKTEWFVALVPA